MTTAIYPGTFDPFTLGHLNITTRAAALFERVIVAVYRNPYGKAPLFTPEERAELIRETVAHLPNVEVTVYTGLTAAFARQVGARAIVRGMRSLIDFEREFHMAQLNRRLGEEEVDEVVLFADPPYMAISSTYVKEIALAGGEYAWMVPAPVARALARKLKEGRP